MRANRVFLTLAVAVLLFAGPPALAQTWDGGTDANNGGDWATGTNWDPDSVPATSGSVILGDVTEGERIITSTVATTAAVLTMNQATAGGINTLTISSTLTLSNVTSGATVLNQTLGEGVPASALNINVNGGTIAAACSNAIINNQGTMSLASGIVNLSASGTINNGDANNSLAQLLITGTSGIGSLNSTSSARTEVFNNYGTTSVAPDSALILNVNSTNGTAYGVVWTFDNKASGVVNVGSAASSTGGSIIIKSAKANGSNAALWQFANKGEFNLYGNSQILAPNTVLTGQNTNMTLVNSGTMNFVASDAGILLGMPGTNVADLRCHVSVTNSGTMNFKLLAGESSGNVTLGNLVLNQSQARGKVNIMNSGNVNVDDNVTVTMRSVSAGSSFARNEIQNFLGSTLTLGTPESTTAGATIRLQHTGVNDTKIGLSDMIVNNAGTLSMYGASLIEVSTVSGTYTGPLQFTNNSGAIVNFGGTSTIGNAAWTTAFINAGTFNKVGEGEARVASNDTGTSTNSGTIDLQAGSLVFDRPLVNTGTITGAGTIANVEFQGGIITSVVAGALNKNNASALTFDGRASGVVNVNAGTLAFSRLDALDGDASVLVADLAILDTSALGTFTIGETQSIGGNGMFKGNLLVAGIVNPINELAFDGTLSLDTVSNTQIDVASSTAFDSLKGSDSVTFGGILSVSLATDLVVENGTTFHLFDFLSYGGSFSQVAVTGLAENQSAEFNAATGNLTVVPEPATIGLLLSGSLALLIRRRRRA